MNSMNCKTCKDALPDLLLNPAALQSPAHSTARAHIATCVDCARELRSLEATMSLLGEWTGTRWIVAVSQAEGAPTLAEQDAQRDGELRNEVAAHPLVRAVLDTFPGATIEAVRERFVAGNSDTEPPASEAGGDFEDDGGSGKEDET